MMGKKKKSITMWERERPFHDRRAQSEVELEAVVVEPWTEDEDEDEDGEVEEAAEVVYQKRVC